ncbi:MAG: hypothetical protein M1825_004884 [Sarcosagium campestre]|nr:MAG: hypothetical protein M1825_004884 [Sarcosagium campestre]
MHPPPGLRITSSPPLSLSAVETTTGLLSISGDGTIGSADVILSTLSSAVAAASTAATKVSGHEDGPQHHSQGECELLGPFSLFIQGALGLLALSSLVWKRYRERPQRPLKIWSFDVSKQLFGSVLVHAANLLMSLLSAGKFDVSPTGAAAALSRDEEVYQPNPCSFYLLNLAIDTTLGIPILIFLLRLLTYAFSLTPFGQPPESIQSGNYGRPPKAWWWFKQSIIYFLGLMGMKVCVLFIFTVLPWISRIGDWALRWTEGNETIQVIFVMLLFPVIMNAIQYYIIDSFIKDRSPSDHDLIPGDDDEDEDDEFDGHGPSIDSTADSLEGSTNATKTIERSEDRSKPKTEALPENGRGNKEVASSSRVPSRKGSQLKIVSDAYGEYSPTADGDESPTVVGSANADERGSLLSNSGDGANSKAGSSIISNR